MVHKSLFKKDLSYFRHPASGIRPLISGLGHWASGIGPPFSALRLGLLYSLLISIFGLAACQSAPQHREDALTHMRLGDTLLREGRPAQALGEVIKARELDPDNPAIRNLLGIVYLEKDMTPQALQEFQSALRLDPNFTEVRNNLGIALLRTGRLQEALVEFNKTLEDPLYLTPQFAYYNLGQAYSALRDYEKARKNYYEAIRLVPNYSLAFHALGLSWKETRHYEEAAAAFKKAIEYAPQFLQAHYDLGEVLVLLDQKSLARLAYQEVVRQAPESELGRKAERKLRELR